MEPDKVFDPNILVRRERRRQLALLSKKTKPPARLPVWRYPIAVEREYRAILFQYVRNMQEAANRLLLPALPALETEASASKPKTDAWSDNLDALVQTLSVTIDKENKFDFPTITADIGQKTSEWNSKEWQKTIRTAFGVNTLQTEPWLNDQLKSFQSENLALIQSIKNQSLTTLQGSVQRALKGGLRHEEIAAQIQQVYGSTQKRARLIARDQVAKLNGQLTELRQKDMGVTEYRWQTSADERVRPTHAAHEGKIYKWNEPPADTGHPGQDYQCRCWAEPILNKFYGEEEGAVPEPAPTAPTELDFGNNEPEALKWYDKNGEIITYAADREKDLAWSYYKSSGYNHVNGYLRGEIAEQTFYMQEHKVIETMDAMMKPLKDPLLVYRGIRDVKVFQGAAMNVGDVIAAKDYWSTSMVEEVAFGRLRKEGALLKIHVPKGTKAIVGNRPEVEILLARDGKYKIISVSKLPDGRPIYEMKLVKGAQKVSAAPLAAPAIAPEPAKKVVYHEVSGNYVDILHGTGKSWAERLPQNEARAIKLYTAKDYGPINRILRGVQKSSSYYASTIDEMSVALQKTSAPFNMVVYRGAGIEHLKLKDPVKGLSNVIYHEKGFSSTSADKKSAFETGIDQHLMMKVKIPKGHKGVAYVSKLSYHPSEQEVLIDRGAKYKLGQVKFVREKGGVKYYEVEAELL